MLSVIMLSVGRLHILSEYSSMSMLLWMFNIWQYISQDMGNSIVSLRSPSLTYGHTKHYNINLAVLFY